MSIFISEQETQSNHLPHQNAGQEQHLVKSTNMKYTLKDIYTGPYCSAVQFPEHDFICTWYAMT